jgi:hypothetical protein
MANKLIERIDSAATRGARKESTQMHSTIIGPTESDGTPSKSKSKLTISHERQSGKTTIRGGSAHR